ncbi:HDIG domain-containing protein [Candidatus Woesearchaeota archaeon]|nr:HDIG domain-containing protein [Candidatus Woesearchaeota archaeon]
MKITEEQAIAILKKHAPNGRVFQIVLQHGKAVQLAALSIAQAIKKRRHKVNLDLITTASILHDIGRFTCPPNTKSSLKHGIAGAKILRKEKLPKHARIAETHLGAGITKIEIIKQKLPLPKKDFLPKTIEQKVIAYADNLILGDRPGTVSQIVERFEKENLPLSAKKRLIKLHNEIEKLRGGLQTL